MPKSVSDFRQKYRGKAKTWNGTASREPGAGRKRELRHAHAPTFFQHTPNLLTTFTIFVVNIAYIIDL
jgi:hypothetical protein